jgi:hypothetical protein
MEVVSAIAYYDTETITAVKSFILHAQPLITCVPCRVLKQISCIVSCLLPKKIILSPKNYKKSSFYNKNIFFQAFVDQISVKNKL